LRAFRSRGRQRARPGGRSHAACPSPAKRLVQALVGASTKFYRPVAFVARLVRVVSVKLPAVLTVAITARPFVPIGCFDSPTLGARAVVMVHLASSAPNRVERCDPGHGTHERLRAWRWP